MKNDNLCSERYGHFLELCSFAPPVPARVQEEFLNTLLHDNDNKTTPLWNDGWLNKLAHLEARWKIAFANQMQHQLVIESKR